MVKIKFGTDGWRAIIAREYTEDNVMRVAAASADWMVEHGGKQVVIGFDCRFGGLMFTKASASVFASRGIKVLMSDTFVSTPMVSLAVVQTKSDLGVVITASHNPPDYNGFKLKSALGGPSVPKDISAVEDRIKDDVPTGIDTFESYKMDGLIEFIDMETMYVDHVEKHFDMDLIRASGAQLAYDAMYGAGQRVLPRLIPDAYLLHCDDNPSFKGQAPEPIHRNLKSLSEVLKSNSALKAGLANDGDADRIGMYDENGNFVDSHQILLLLLYYMAEVKGDTGKVVVTFSVTDKMKKLAKHFGLETIITPIGFKYIAEIMITEDVIVGGEESGGLAVKGHIPERDGIWIGLVLLEFMAKSGKTLSELVQDIFKITGSFAFDRDDLHITESLKTQIIQDCKNGEIQKIGDRSVIKTETIDGFKFYLSEDEWVMIRPSGTEPVLRVYAQGTDMENVRAILDATHSTLKK